MKKYDVVVIGAGPAGLSAAISLKKNNYKVLLVSEKIGGTYSGYGSVISNALLYFSNLYNLFHKQTKNFINFNIEEDLSFNFDFSKTKKYVESVANKAIKTFKNEIEDEELEFIQGIATFISDDVIQVISEEKVLEIKADFFIIATGSTNKKLGINNTTKLLGVENICELEKTPASVTIIGGGFIGWEYATFFKRIGSEVTIIEKSNRLLPKFDEQIVKKFEDIQRKNGIKILKERFVENIEKIGNKTILFLNKDDKIESEKVFVAIGRRPNIDNLSLDIANVKFQNNMPVLNAHMQTTNKKIFIVGDASGLEMLVNWAYKTSEIVVNRIMGQRKRNKFDYIPKVLNVDPEIASVGFTSEIAVKEGFNVASYKYSYLDFEKSLLQEHPKITLKIIYDKETKKLLGTHIMGNGAEDLISVFSLLIQSGVKIDNITEYILNVPAFYEILNELGNKLKEKANA